MRGGLLRGKPPLLFCSPSSLQSGAYSCILFSQYKTNGGKRDALSFETSVCAGHGCGRSLIVSGKRGKRIICHKQWCSDQHDPEIAFSKGSQTRICAKKMQKFLWCKNTCDNKRHAAQNAPENGLEKIMIRVLTLGSVDPESGGRMILPGAAYAYPERRHKLDPLAVAAEKIIETTEKSGGELSSALLNTIDGFSPLLCREAAFKAELSGSLSAALGGIISDLKNSGTPLLLIKSDGTPQDFSFTDISQYGSMFEKKVFQSYSQLLEEFYSARDTADRMKHAAGDIVKLVNNLKARTEKKLALRIQELKSCENREQLRIYGELLKANLYKAVSGANFIEVENYYDDMKQIRIPLDPTLSPQKNAAKYFKDYKKSHTAEQTLTELTRRDEQELIYFDSVLESISRSSTKAEISEIREELTAGGYLKALATKPKKTQVPVLREYKSAEGYRIIVGKNNRQNDYITTTLAAKNDLWFHTKNIPGSHVVVMCGGKEVSDETLIYAATLAAENSGAAAGAQVPVDYTPVKFVKKPNGAKPGMVIYTTNKTLYVTPNNGGKL